MAKKNDYWTSQRKDGSWAVKKQGQTERLPFTRPKQVYGKKRDDLQEALNQKLF